MTDKVENSIYFEFYSEFHVGNCYVQSTYQHLWKFRSFKSLHITLMLKSFVTLSSHVSKSFFTNVKGWMKIKLLI